MGGICREDNSIFLELIPNRTSNSLMLSIYNSVEYGSSIITDLWKGYLFLDIPEFPEAYGHATVNHSTNLINILYASYECQISTGFLVSIRVTSSRPRR